MCSPTCRVSRMNSCEWVIIDLTLDTVSTNVKNRLDEVTILEWSIFSLKCYLIMVYVNIQSK